MIIIIAAVFIGILILFWLWKVPISGMADALQEGGSSTFEAYAIITILIGGSAAVIYLIWDIM
jgi:hypothetical protein